MPLTYDAILWLSFGGPEGHEEVMPFLENVVHGRPVPRQRLAEVAQHYHHFGGKSPINEQNRRMIAALQDELAQHGVQLPVYWGNRNWQPFLVDALRQMQADGVRRALAFVTSSFSSYSGCRQYREDIARAQQQLVEAPSVEKLRVFYDHPLFIAAMVEQTAAALAALPSSQRADAAVVFTAHSLPERMASACDYEAQLRQACSWVADRLPHSNWQLVFQSRSGAPHDPWLGPDVLDHIAALAARRVPALVLAPIGFVSDHMEVVWDLDVEAKQACERHGIVMQRATTVGSHPHFAPLVRELLQERLGDEPARSLSPNGARPFVCPSDCCPPASPASLAAIRPKT